MSEVYRPPALQVLLDQIAERPQDDDPRKALSTHEEGGRWPDRPTGGCPNAYRTETPAPDGMGGEYVARTCRLKSCEYCRFWLDQQLAEELIDAIGSFSRPVYAILADLEPKEPPMIEQLLGAKRQATPESIMRFCSRKGEPAVRLQVDDSRVVIVTTAWRPEAEIITSWAAIAGWACDRPGLDDVILAAVAAVPAYHFGETQARVSKNAVLRERIAELRGPAETHVEVTKTADTTVDLDFEPSGQEETQSVPWGLAAWVIAVGIETGVDGHGWPTGWATDDREIAAEYHRRRDRLARRAQRPTVGRPLRTAA